jgi:hypothetical protein
MKDLNVQILNAAQHGGITQEQIKAWAVEHRFHVQHIRRCIRLLVEQGLIQKYSLTESGMKYLQERGEE